jgi:hypothetical protein
VKKEKGKNWTEEVYRALEAVPLGGFKLYIKNRVYVCPIGYFFGFRINDAANVNHFFYSLNIRITIFFLCRGTCVSALKSGGRTCQDCRK